MKEKSDELLVSSANNKIDLSEIKEEVLSDFNRMKQKLGERLEAGRVGKSVLKISKETGINIEKLAKIEKGVITPDLLELYMICRCYGLSLKEIFSE